MKTNRTDVQQDPNAIRKELNRRGRRMTPQRAAILEVLRSDKTHPTAEDVYTAVQALIPKISLGTVYRNLQVLVDEGYAIRLQAPGGSSRFDGDVSDHHHIVCRECGRMDDVYLKSEPGLLRQVGRKTGYRVEGQRTEFTGICGGCRNAK
jgi:Fur family ferric uptake transcriptional regulator